MSTTTNGMHSSNPAFPTLTLASSLTFYPCVLRLLNGSKPTSSQLSASIRILSTIHSSVTTLLALALLSHLPPLDSYAAPTSGYDGTAHPLIALRSGAANSLTALETGYLLSSIPALLKEARAHGTKPSKTMLAHHAGIGTALLLLQAYVWRGKERGVYVIVMFLLMNASTPFMNLRWLLRRKGIHKRLVNLTDQVFLVAFLVARVLLVPGIVRYYGQVKGLGWGETWWNELRWQCRLGTGALWVGNLAWWIAAVSKIERQWLLKLYDKRKDL